MKRMLHDRRCRLKVEIAFILLAALLVMSSWTASRAAPAEPGRWDNPTASMLGYARGVYRLQGGPYGEALIYLERWPQYAPYITGQVDSIDACG